MQAQKNSILAEVPARSSRARRRWVLAVVAGTSLLGVVAATAVAPGQATAPISVESVVERLAAPLRADSIDAGLPFVFDERIQPGDTVHSIFARLGIRDPEALDFLVTDADARSALRQLRAGRSVLAFLAADRKIVSFELPVSADGGRFTMVRTADGIEAGTKKVIAGDTEIEMRSGSIRHSLFGATDAAGVPDAVATKLAEIFGTEIDFSVDLRRGDRFSVVYETLRDRGLPVGTGRILAAEFINDGKKYSVVLHRDAEGNEVYYTPDGRGLNQAFLRYPLEFSRISSSFGRRLHPIHRKWRSHDGVDFAAPSGTPVKAASDGVVDFVGTQNGYGKIVVLRHRDGYATAYAHLNGFYRGLRKGAKVRQGELVGYVGSTGWATGPHLHYEIRVNSVPHDPMKIALPMAQPLARGELAAFRQAAEPLLKRLDLMNQPMVARAD